MDLIYKTEGQAMAVGAIITLVVGMSVATMTMTLTGVISGQTYALSEAQISDINNSTIQGYVRDSIVSGFKAQKTTGDFLPIVSLAVITALVLSLILGLGAMGGGSVGGGRSAL